MARAIIDEEADAKRQSAAYIAKINMLRRSDPDMPEAEMDRVALTANDEAVFGHDAKRDRHGRYIQQGIGSPGHETANHFASIRRWQSEAEWRIAVKEIWKRDPQRAERLRLPNLDKLEKTS